MAVSDSFDVVDTSDYSQDLVPRHGPTGFGGLIVGAPHCIGRCSRPGTEKATDVIRTVSCSSGNSELAWFAAVVSVVVWKYTGMPTRSLVSVVTAGGIQESQVVRYHVLIDVEARLCDIARQIDIELMRNAHGSRDIARDLEGEATCTPICNVGLLRDSSTHSTSNCTDHVLQVALHGPDAPAGLVANFDRAYYAPDLVQRFLDNILHVCEQLHAIQESRVSDVEVVCASERRTLLRFNDTHRVYPHNKTIDAVFEECVTRCAKTSAVVSHDVEITYEQLNSCSNQLANQLCSLPLHADDVVTVVADRSPSAIIGMLAALKAGGCYLPINYRDPVARRQYMLEKSKTNIVLYEEGLGIDPETLCVGSVHTILPLNTSIPVHASPNPSRGMSPTDLAYVMYTSGTSGVPKAVMVEHRSVLRLVLNTNYFEFRPDTRILHASAIEFDAATFEIWGSLLNGLTLYIASRDDILSPQSLARTIEEWGITALLLTTPLFAQFASTDPDIFASLDCLLIGGDRLSPQHTNIVRRRFPRLKIINGYGPTENTTFSSTFSVDREYEGSIPIGSPIANSTIYILDERSHLTPIGAYGELCTGGNGVARGYLNDVKLTQERFCSYPGEARIYRTGDSARWLPDGNIEFSGRRDDQLKIRGYRVDPSEIENVLREHENVRNAAVLGIKDETGGKRLVAFVAADESLPPSSIRDFLLARLPEYMVPSRFVVLRQFPLTPSGKLDRSTLLEELARSSSEARTIVEDVPEKLQRAWNEVIGFEDACRTDNFFEAGGDSLKAIDLLNRVECDFAIDVTMRTFFSAPTLSNLAKLIRQGDFTLKPQGVTKQPEQLWYELSVSQTRLAELWERHPNSNAHNCAQRLTWNGQVNETALRSALGEICRRHDIFRTRIEKRGSRFVQIVDPKQDICINTIDLSHLDEQEQQFEADRLYTQDAATPVPLNDRALYRANLVRFGDTRMELHLTIHHIVYDGWSRDVLLRELDTLYADYAHGRANSLAAVEYQFKDYVVWHNQLLSDPSRCRPLVDFWSQYLGGYSKRISPPYDQPGAGPDVGRASSGYRFVIPDETTRKLRIVASMNDTTIFMVMFAAFNLLLRNLTNEDDIVTGIPSANRRHDIVKNTLGFFVDSVLVRVKSCDCFTFQEYLSIVSESTLNSLEYSHYPIEKACETVEVTWPQILASFFNMTTFGSSKRTRLVDQEWKHFAHVQESKLEFVFYLVEYLNGVEINVHYYNRLYSPASVESYVRKYVHVLDVIAADQADKFFKRT